MEGSVIGVSLGTRLAGIAVMRRKELLVYKVKTFKGSWSKEKENEILELFDKIFEHYRVKYLGIKIISPLHSSKAVDDLIKNLIQLATEKGIKVSTYPLHEIRKSLTLNKRQNLNEFIANKYTELKKEYEQEQNSFNIYYSKMFEAIAIAYLLAGKIKG